MSALSLRQVYIEDKYIIMHSIGSGHFGDIRVAKNVETEEYFAVKLEDSTKQKNKLENEMKLYQKLRKKYILTLDEITDESNVKKSTYGFPEAYLYGSFKNYNYLIMELLGYNLETLFNSCNRKFSFKCVAMIGMQLLTRLEFVHSCEIIFRDMKPENFVIGKELSDKGRVIYMLDFGLAKECTDLSHELLKDHYTKKIVGTSRYMSINSHKGKEQTRKDDLESLAYILIYFGKGNLPWQGISNGDIQEKYKKILEMKSSINGETLCKGLPKQLNTFLNYVNHLSINDDPNYEVLHELLNDILISRSEICDWKFDWDGTNSVIQNSVENTVNMITNDIEIRSSDFFCSTWSCDCLCCGLKITKASKKGK